MAVEMGIWRIDGRSPRRLDSGKMPSEAELEDFLVADPSLLGEKLLVISRQLRTPYGKIIDLLAIDDEGDLHVLELKRDRTPREVVAQVLDYGTWASELDRDSIIELAREHLDQPLEEAFGEAFDAPLPEELNNTVQLTIVAAELDNSSERIVSYLRTFGVPINAVFFTYLEDEDRRYLARSWLASQDSAETGSAATKGGKRAAWNGKDWFVTFGDGGSRSWEDARRYGFVSAGGGEWYTRTLQNLPIGARISVVIPKSGYVAVGETLGTARVFDEAEVQIDDVWTALKGLELQASYRHEQDGNLVDAKSAEYVVPVRWFDAVPREEALWVKGMFANQNSAGKLRDQFTLDRLADRFALPEAES